MSVFPATDDEPPLVSGWSSIPWYLRYTQDPLGTLLAGQQRFGNVFAFARPSLRGNRHQTVFAIGADYNRQVLSNPELFHSCSMAPKAPPGSAMERMRRGFQPATNAGSARLRRMTQAPFSKKSVLGYHDEMVLAVEEALAAWPTDQPFDAAARLRALSLALSNRLLFGAAVPERVCRLGELLDEFVRRAYFSSAVLLPFHFPGSPYARLQQTCDEIAALLDEMIAARRQAATGRRDLLELLVQQQEPGAEVEVDLLGPSAFLWIASFETLATALTWTILLLAQHPETAAELRESLASELHGAAPLPEQLEHLPLLDAVIHESLRLFPPIPIVFRRSRRADQRLGGMPVGWGDWVFLSQYATHRLPELYDRPRQFVPERWFSIRPGVYEYFPWGAGPRACIGYALGMTALRTCLAIFVQRFTFSVPPQARIDRTVKVTINPRQGLPLVLHAPTRDFVSHPIRGQFCEMVDLPPPHRAAARPPRAIPLRMKAVA